MRHLPLYQLHIVAPRLLHSINEAPVPLIKEGPALCKPAINMQAISTDKRLLRHLLLAKLVLQS